jgi:DNA ligase 1
MTIKPMLAYPFDINKLNRMSLPWMIQPKLDGMRCIAEFTPGGVVLWSRLGNPILTVPHVVHQLGSLGLHDCLLDGELYSHKLNFQQLVSIVKRGTLHMDFRTVEYRVFDIIDSQPQEERLKRLVYLLPDSANIKLVPSLLAANMDELNAALEHHLRCGYEGIIIRDRLMPYEHKRSTTMLKLKPTKRDDYIIAGCEEEISIHGEPKNALGALILTATMLCSKLELASLVSNAYCCGKSVRSSLDASLRSSIRSLAPIRCPASQ